MPALAGVAAALPPTEKKKGLVNKVKRFSAGATTAPPDLGHYVALWEVTNKQDARNCEWQQEGLRSRAFEHGWYVPQEFDAHRFAQWVREGLAPQPTRRA